MRLSPCLTARTARAWTWRAPVGDLFPVLLAGAVLRILWIIATRGGLVFVDAGEATHVAISVARGDGFADAFGDGRPTAHLMPVTPLIAAGVLRLFGVDGWPGHLALGLWALLQTGAAYLLLHRLFAVIGMDERPRRAALVLLCLLPVFVAQEAQDFRYWEGGLSVCLAAVNLFYIVRWAKPEPVKRRRLAGAAALAAFTFLVNPAVGLAVDACWGVWAFRQLSPRRCLVFAAMALMALVAVLTPWTLRNMSTLRAAVPVRSNFGLEIAIGNHPAAVSGMEAGAVFTQRLRNIHPYHGKAPLAELHAAGGEVAYARAWQARTCRWIGDHPAQFLQLSVRHYRQFFFPEPWQFLWSGSLVARSAIVCGLNLAGLLALAIGLMRQRRGFGYLALYVVVVALPYAVVQPIPRYTYLVSGLLTFLAVELAWSAARRWREMITDRSGFRISRLQP